MAEFEVRPFEADDLERFLLLGRRLVVGIAPWRDRDAVENAIQDSLRKHVADQAGTDLAAFVAVTDGVLVGAVTVAQRHHFAGTLDAHVDDLFVADDTEGSGIGTALLAEAERWAAAQGCVNIVIETSARNTRAQDLYRHLGYEDEDVRLTKPLASG